MIRVKELTQTCSACPAQWSGQTDDGRSVYVRYRWGYLSVRVSDEVSDDEMAGVGGSEVFGSQLGDGLDGTLSFGDLKSATAGEVEWPA